MRKALKPMLLAAFVAGLSSVAAYADDGGGDNSMTPHYGDSWANIQGHEATTVPGLEANEDSAAARAAWATREKSTWAVRSARPGSARGSTFFWARMACNVSPIPGAGAP